MSWNPVDNLSDTQRDKLQQYQQLLLRYNRKINMVSRTSTDTFWEDHIEHSLTLTYRAFPDGCTVVDWGTGGGLPAIPLAVAFPEVRFYAVDAVEKKVQAVRSFARRLELDNLFAWHGRAEKWSGSAHYSVSRATAPLAALWQWHRRVVAPLDSEIEADGVWAPGLICLKGGDLSAEKAELHELEGGSTVGEIPLYSLVGADKYRNKVIVSVSV